MLATTRAVNVEALKPWSTVRMRYCSRARTAAGWGSSPVDSYRYGRDVAERGVWMNQPPSVGEPVQSGEHGGYERGHLQRLCTAGGLVEIEQRPQTEGVGARRQHRAQLGQRGGV